MEDGIRVLLFIFVEPQSYRNLPLLPSKEDDN